MSPEHAMGGNPRLSAIWETTVRKLQEVVREFAITQDELHAAGDYFNRLGQSGFSRSLIDVALAMTSVDVVDGVRGGTRPNLEGPYHVEHALRPDGNLLDRPPLPQETRLTLTGVVRDAVSGGPIPGMLLDFWQADGEGIYDLEGGHLRGMVISDSQGRYRICTVVPNDYSQHDHDPIGELFRAMGRPNSRAAHLHLKASRDDREYLTTQLFMPTSVFLDTDYVTGAVSDDLILVFEPDGLDERGKPCVRAAFDIRLAVL
jgi:catechol 1,2-dioxygenase